MSASAAHAHAAQTCLDILRALPPDLDFRTCAPMSSQAGRMVWILGYRLVMMRCPKSDGDEDAAELGELLSNSWPSVGPSGQQLLTWRYAAGEVSALSEMLLGELTGQGDVVALDSGDYRGMICYRCLQHSGSTLVKISPYKSARHP
jgi:hypothetical protein